MRTLRFLFGVGVFLSVHTGSADVQLNERPGPLAVPSATQVFLPDLLAIAMPMPSISRRIFLLPADGIVSSPFGWRIDPIDGGRRFHAGLDVANLRRGRVIAAATGVVAFAGWRRGCGLMAVIEHGGDVETRYCHLDSLCVHAGELVSAGEPLGRMGQTGRTTGRHLHFEMREGGCPVDPAPKLMF